MESRWGARANQGGGRKPATQTDPGLGAALLALVEPGARGDPESPLGWTTKSLRRLQTELAAAGHRVSAPTLAKLLKAEGFNYEEIAATLGLSRGAIGTTLARARRRLLEAYRTQGRSADAAS